ncbi:uncharacterized protein [Battus philenor]|uniref:uncharacterized protein n=1 Tax=Battus philenor TaxID=42288 RepID=UPI0035D0802F
MKRVRFESPTKVHIVTMNDFECQSPRPFIEKKIIPQVPDIRCDNVQVLPFSNDPLQRYECGNGSPYPIVNKTCLADLSNIESKWTPSNDLELSFLDSCGHKVSRSILQESNLLPNEKVKSVHSNKNTSSVERNPRILSSLQNSAPNLIKVDDFFLRRENMHNISTQNLNSSFKKLTIEKENNPLIAKNELMTIDGQLTTPPIRKNDNATPLHSVVLTSDHCKCYNCMRVAMNNPLCTRYKSVANVYDLQRNRSYCKNLCSQHTSNSYENIYCDCNSHTCHKVYKKCVCEPDNLLRNDKNTVDKKTWALRKYEESNGDNIVDIEKQGLKEKREPTVADLFKIIKLQNEQLQLLQDKVDKFISATKFESPKQPLPLQNYVTEHVAVETVDKEHQKISIGVMTSFEVVRTSTIINKEIAKQSSEAQIQCNRSQISIKQVQSANLNFLDGITPVTQSKNTTVEKSYPLSENKLPMSDNWNKDNINDEKTLNEMSLCNIQVDNATTPLMSPEQSLYLDVRDYSDSESDAEDQSNVGWTYYNKVMTHVNGMLHDSDMPSSASALYRNTRQKCMQMKIDKTNVSVIKRVKFGDDPVGTQQQNMAASTDTSLKMNQLAAKYLKKASDQTEVCIPTSVPIDMSFATRNYMEKHQLLQVLPTKANAAPTVEMPRFLDITALKQQPKLL